MITTQSDIRGRIEQLRLSDTGYRKQLALANISPERRERLDIDIRLMQQEIATLEKVAQLERVEPDAAKVETAVRERLEALRARLASDPALSELAGEERDMTSGEVRALMWVLGEDRLTENMRLLMAGHDRSDPTRTDRAVPNILVHTLEEAPDAEARAGAAYELGKLNVSQAIPALARALEDDPLVAETALRALSMFTPGDLQAAGLDAALIARARDAKGPS
jgi:predicted HTH domain antitoxin